MSCASNIENHKCNSSKAEREGDGAKGCLKPGTTINDANEYSINTICSFGSPGGCSTVCACHSVTKCYEDCSNYVASSHNDPRIDVSYLNSGNIIYSDDFKNIKTYFKNAADEVKVNLEVKYTKTKGDVIDDSDLSDFISKYYKAMTLTSSRDMDGQGISTLSSCVYGSVIRTIEDFITEGNIIKASDWNNLIRHYEYMSTCCNCVENYKYKCSQICYCVCFY